MEILVVDDEEGVGRIFAQRLRHEIRAGAMVVHFATSGLAALEVLEQRQGALSVVLTDINMPGMSGFELLHRVRSQLPTVPVYMVTAYEDEDFRQKALDAGAAGFFAKPMEFGDLRALLARVSGAPPAGTP